MKFNLSIHAQVHWDECGLGLSGPDGAAELCSNLLKVSLVKKWLEFKHRWLQNYRGIQNYRGQHNNLLLLMKLGLLICAVAGISMEPSWRGTMWAYELNRVWRRRNLRRQMPVWRQVWRWVTAGLRIESRTSAVTCRVWIFSHLTHRTDLFWGNQRWL